MDSVTYFPTPSENTHLFFLASISSLLILFLKPVPLKSLACSVSKCSEVRPNALLKKEIPVQIQNILLKMTPFTTQDLPETISFYSVFWKEDFSHFQIKLCEAELSPTEGMKNWKASTFMKEMGTGMFLPCIKSS